MNIIKRMWGNSSLVLLRYLMGMARRIRHSFHTVGSWCCWWLLLTCFQCRALLKKQINHVAFLDFANVIGSYGSYFLAVMRMYVQLLLSLCKLMGKSLLLLFLKPQCIMWCWSLRQIVSTAWHSSWGLEISTEARVLTSLPQFVLPFIASLKHCKWEFHRLNAHPDEHKWFTSAQSPVAGPR